MDESKKKSQSRITPLRTLKTDTSAYIKKKGISRIDIASAEAKRGVSAGLGYKRTKKPPIIKMIILALLILVSAASAAGAVFLFLKQKQSARQPAVVLQKSIVSADDESEITINEIQNIMGARLSPNKLLYFPIIEKTGGIKRLISSREFFGGLGISPAPGLIGALEDKFMLAVFRLAQKWPILIFKVRSYEHGFAAMLKWEKNMAYDLAELLGLEGVESLDNLFQDREIKNRDARVLNDSIGDPVLLYSFVGRKYLVITTNEEALQEAFRRLSSPQYLNE